MNEVSSTPNEISQTMDGFVAWARQQGWRYQLAPIQLGLLQRFLRRHGVDRLCQIDAAMLADFQRFLSVQRRAATVNGYLHSVRAWWRYLLKEELVVADATRSLRYLRPDYFVPYLYSVTELSRIGQAAQVRTRHAPSSQVRLSRWTHYAAFGLLRDCGLRISEASRLNLGDYDPRARTLRIELTKFFKSRQIPLPRRTCTLLNQYLVQRHKLGGEADESLPLFVSALGNRVHRVTFEGAFKQLLCSLDLYHPRRRQGRTVFGSTNLHALRRI